MECDVCNEIKDSKEIFNCDGCKILICKSCGKLTSSEVRVLQMSTRVMKFNCTKCMKNETFSLLHKIIETKDELIQSKEATIVSKEMIIDMLQKDLEALKNSKQIPTMSYTPLKTYASTLSNSQKLPQTNLPSIIIKPKKEQSSNTTRADVHNTIKPSELKIAVQNMRPTKNGGIVIKCPTRNDIEVLQKEANNKLNRNYEIEVTKMRKPRIKIAAFNLDLDESEIEKCIKEQNQIFAKEDELKITYIKKRKDRDSIIYGECTAGLFHKLMSIKKVFIKWQRFPVYEDISFNRCFKCQEFYHKITECQRKVVCPYCSEEHEYKMCPKSQIKCNNCTIANEKYNTNHDTNHEAADPVCPSYKYHLQILRSKINYDPHYG